MERGSRVTSSAPLLTSTSGRTFRGTLCSKFELASDVLELAGSFISPDRLLASAGSLFRSRVEKKLAHLAGRIARDGGLLRPCQCLIHIGGFQYPKSANVLLGLGVRPVGDENLAVALLSHSPCVGGRGNAA